MSIKGWVIMHKIRRGRLWMWQVIVITVGTSLFLIHLYHFTREAISLAMLIGVLIPMGISLGIIGLGVLLRYQASLRPLAPWLTAWLLLGMTWMTIAATGAILYEQSEGALLSNTEFLIAAFATYGCLPGLVTGWYDGRQRMQTRTVSNREEQLTVLSRILRHNLRNEMNVILGHAQTLVEENTSAVEAHAAAILDAGHTLMKLSEKERRLVETVVNPSERTTLHLRKLLADVLEQVREEYPRAELSVEGEVGQTVRAVPYLERAVREILENAVIHNNMTPPVVSVRVEATGNTVTLRIQDNGPGIPSVETAVIAGDQPISPLNHGSGLGLRLADLIIKQSGGRLKFTSSDSEGTEVRITLKTA